MNERRQIHGIGPRRSSRTVAGRYDAASMGGPHVDHWSNSDFLAPDNAASPSVRRILRSRCRYEVFNNSYAAGIVDTMANYVIGTGPTLRLTSRNLGKRTQNSLTKLSAAFNAWAWDVQLGRILKLMQRSKSIDGEGFARLVNRRVASDQAVALGIVPFEADIVSRADEMLSSGSEQPEGIDLGQDGQPVAYHLLKKHPGSGWWPAQASGAAVPVPADLILHWFEESRPGLHRGLPEIMPALFMFAQLRRYTSAVVTAAETAADFAAVLQTDAPPGGEQEADQLTPGDSFPLEKGTAVAAPYGWKISQVKAEHPGPQHEAFIRCIVREIARCLNMPYAVAALDASGHNYASMRGDWQAFFQGIRICRRACEQQVLDKILRSWMAEARLVLGVTVPPEYDYAWDWPDFEPTDPVKEATAATIRLKGGLTTYAREYSRLGLNWEDEFAQRAIEEGVKREKGLSFDTPAMSGQPEDQDNGNDDDGGPGK